MSFLLTSHHVQAGIEILEQRIAPAVFLVTSVADAGAGTLRQAILDANAAPGPDVIQVKIAGESMTAKYIALSSALPAITGPTVLDATSQASYAGQPLIQLKPTTGTQVFPGLVFDTGATGSILKGFAISGFTNGVEIKNTVSNVTVVANWIGSGLGANYPSNSGVGILVSGGNDHVLGAPTLGNVISKNTGGGILVNGGARTKIQANIVGLDSTGFLSGFGNGPFGIKAVNDSDLLIGGSLPGEGNVISGNYGVGIEIRGTRTMVVGNKIGTDVSGSFSDVVVNNFVTRSLGNAARGILIYASQWAVAQNVIAGNLSSAIYVGSGGSAQSPPHIENNLIGVDATGTKAIGNSGAGISLSGTAGVLVSGNTIAACVDGIRIGSGAPANDNIIIGNRIGTDITGQVSEGVAVYVSGYSGQRLPVASHAFGNTSDGIAILNGSRNRIGGATAAEWNVIAGNGDDGLSLGEKKDDSASSGPTTGNYVGGNLIGLDATGGNVLGNHGHGINLGYYASGNFIGLLPTTPRSAGSLYLNTYLSPAGPIISGNLGDGIHIEPLYGVGTSASTGNNYFAALKIGTDETGALDLGNGGAGIGIKASHGNTIGLLDMTRLFKAADTNLSLYGSVIAGNEGGGIVISNANSTTINLARIGTTADGLSPLGNGGAGITLTNASFTRIGEDVRQNLLGNVIAANGSDGVLVKSGFNLRLRGNAIGTDLAGGVPLGNLGNGVHFESTATTALIAKNTIAANAGAGIRIDGAGSVNIETNQIGAADLSASAVFGNKGDGIFAAHASKIAVGAGERSFGNVIVLNGGSGVHFGAGISAASAQNNIVLGSGVDGIAVSGSSALIEDNSISASGRGSIRIEDSIATIIAANQLGTEHGNSAGDGIVVVRSAGTLIGGDSLYRTNVIRNHEGAGIVLGEGANDTEIFLNTIAACGTGILIDGAARSVIGGEAHGNEIAHHSGAGIAIVRGSGHVISRNAIHDNGGLPVDLGNDGATPNDALDQDAGANGRCLDCSVVSEGRSCINSR